MTWDGLRVKRVSLCQNILYNTIQGFALATFDRDELAAYRKEALTFRDRRPEMYGHLLTMGGKLL